MDTMILPDSTLTTGLRPWWVRPTRGATSVRPIEVIYAAASTDATQAYRTRYAIPDDDLVSAFPRDPRGA